jgi:hypothetical protein
VVIVAAPAPAPPPAPPPRPPREPSLEPVADATCIVHGTGVRSTLPLYWHGKHFASVAGDVDLRATADAATLTVSNDEVVLTGEPRLDALVVYPRTRTVVDGWLVVLAAPLTAVSGASAILSPTLPRRITTPRAPTATVPCADLTFREPPAADAKPAAGKPLWLAPGTKTALRVEPKGAPVATIAGRPAGRPNKGSGAAIEAQLAADTPDAFELARRDGAVQIRVADSGALAEGWIDAAAVGKRPPASGMAFGILGALGSGGLSDGASVVCPHDTPLWVRDEGRAVQVGHVRANATIRVRVLAEDGGPEDVPVTLNESSFFAYGGLGVKDASLDPFVRRSALIGCARTK